MNQNKYIVKISYNLKYEKYFEQLILNVQYNYNIKNYEYMNKMLVFNNLSYKQSQNILSTVNKLRNTIDEHGNYLKFDNMSVLSPKPICI